MVTISYGYAAVRHPRQPGKWLAQFTGEIIGTRWVRDKDGDVKAFATEAEAERAANAGLIEALNAPRGPVKGRALRVRRSNFTSRQRAYIEAGQVFSSRAATARPS